MDPLFELLNPYTNIGIAGGIASIVALARNSGIAFLNWGKLQGIMAMVIAAGYFLIDYLVPTFGDPNLTLLGVVLWSVGTGLMATGWHSQLKNAKEKAAGA